MVKIVQRMLASMHWSWRALEGLQAEPVVLPRGGVTLAVDIIGLSTTLRSE